MSLSIDTIRSVFKHQSTNLYTGEPDYEAIKSVHDKLGKRGFYSLDSRREETWPPRTHYVGGNLPPRD